MNKTSQLSPTQVRETCGNCRFSDRVRKSNSPLESMLVCRHSPPVVLAQLVQDAHGNMGQAILSVFPQVSDSEWCHQHQSATAANEAN